MTIVPMTWEIPDKIRERFGDTAGRQRAMFAEGHLLLVLHAPPDADQREREARLFWRNAEGAWASNSKGSGAQALKAHLKDYSSLVEKLESQLHSAACADDYFQLLQEVAPLHRASRNLHTTLQQARDLLADERTIIVARDMAGDIEREIELLHVDSKNGLDYTIAQKTELQSQRSYEMSVSAHRLNMLAAVFFPVTAISSIFGMNLKHGLEAFPHIFWGILTMGFICGIFLAVIIAERPRAPETPPEQPLVPPRPFKFQPTGLDVRAGQKQHAR